VLVANSSARWEVLQVDRKAPLGKTPDDAITASALEILSSKQPSNGLAAPQFDVIDRQASNGKMPDDVITASTLEFFPSNGQSSAKTAPDVAAEVHIIRSRFNGAAPELEVLEGKEGLEVSPKDGGHSATSTPVDILANGAPASSSCTTAASPSNAGDKRWQGVDDRCEL